MEAPMASKTKLFNVSVKAGGKTYLPGNPVPVGGKDGLSIEDADRIHTEFGVFTGAPEVQSEPAGLLGQAEIDALNQRNDTLATEKRELEGKLKEKTAAFERLAADHGTLSTKYAKLEEEHEQLGKDNTDLIGSIDQLGKEKAELAEKVQALETAAQKK